MRGRPARAGVSMRPLVALGLASLAAYTVITLTTPAALIQAPTLRGARNQSNAELREMRKALDALKSGILGKFLGGLG